MWKLCYLFIHLFVIGALKYAAISACYTLLVLILGKHSTDCNVCSNSFRIADYALLGHVLKTVRSQTFEGCLFTCERDPRCFSVNFYAVRASCEMNLGTREDFETDFMPTRGSSYISMVFRQFDPCVTFKACRNGGHCEPYPVTRCVCLEGFSGSLCEGVYEQGKLCANHLV